MAKSCKGGERVAYAYACQLREQTLTGEHRSPRTAVDRRRVGNPTHKNESSRTHRAVKSMMMMMMMMTTTTRKL
jgi:hypothetical protein